MNTDFKGSMHIWSVCMMLCFHRNVFKYAVQFIWERI